MTRVPVDQAPAGPALDAAVAAVWTGREVSTEGWEGIALKTFRPSTDIAAAWELLESLTINENGMVFLPYLNRNVEGSWWVGFDTKFSVTADTAPLAITRAYLKAKGVEEVEVKD